MILNKKGDYVPDQKLLRVLKANIREAFIQAPVDRANSGIVAQVEDSQPITPEAHIAYQANAVRSVLHNQYKDSL